MKTLTELMDNIKALQKGLDEVYGDIAELQEAERSKEDMPDIVDWMNYARQHPLAGHPLTTVDNLETQGIYIKLLFTVAMCHIYLKHEISPLVYPCQIAAALGKNINGERLFKESLTLDSLTIREYCEQIKRQGLDAYFLIDSLIVTVKYEQDNHEKMDYIASLAAIMEVYPEKFADIITLAKAYVEEPKEFVGRLMEVYTPESLFYLKSCTSFKVIDTPICFVAHSESMRECDEAICQFLPISNKVSAVFSNISFKNTEENKLTFSNMKQLEFYDCEFKDFDHTVINADSIEKIVMERVQFINCVYENHIDNLPDNDDLNFHFFEFIDLWNGIVNTGISEEKNYNFELERLKKNWDWNLYTFWKDNILLLNSGIIGTLIQVGNLVMDNVIGNGCYVRHFITFVYHAGGWNEPEWCKANRELLDYTENALFKGISKKQIEVNNCTWEKCCNLVEGEE